MQVYLALVQDGDDEVAAAKLASDVAQAINAWLGDGKKGVQSLAADAGGPGLEIAMNNKAALKEPLNALQIIATQNRCNFVVGMIDSDTGEKEDVCYFGHEEGRPDLYEIACYLGWE
jgi:hypothetical protein